MTDNPEEKQEQEPGLPEPERPLECGDCRRPIAVIYTEIIGDSITRTCMCSECPVLRLKLHGAPHTEIVKGQTGLELVCGNCGTTLDSIRRGTLLGCDVCYEVFDDILIPEMLAAEKVPARFSNIKKNTPVHMGRAPGEIQEINPAIRLIALNDALKEMLKSEDYEQAAWLRDQIKALTEEPGDKNDSKQ